MTRPLQFESVALGGFGDRHNSWAWSMLWWKDHLYVGTNRAFYCAEQAAMNYHLPFLIKYPPKDEDVDCLPDASDLALQAEIWRWTPEMDTWNRVFQSPRDVPNPRRPGKLLPRELGIRGMAPFVEPDGMEALYVSGVNTRFLGQPVPAPRLLRTTSGETFTPIPQEPGTFLGDLDACSLRTPVVYRGRLYVQAGSVRGEGVLLESASPARGNNHFRQVSPPSIKVFDMAVFGDYLYLGLRYTDRGYAIYKTDARGSPHCRLIPVVTDGAYHPNPSRSVISMTVFNGMLYVGTDRPAEIIRIHPDDRWDLVVGTPRRTPEGWKRPISTLDAGFSNWLNGHIWRMQVYQEQLYVGTWNMSTLFRHADGAKAVLAPHYGFDLYVTDDGWHFTPLTTTGFGQQFNEGLRTFAATPYGLFVGTANAWHGLQIWRGRRDRIASSGAAAPEAPQELAIDMSEGRVLLSWSPVENATEYRVFRAAVHDRRHLLRGNRFVRWVLAMARTMMKFAPAMYFPPVPDKLLIPGPYAQIGTTQGWHFVDAATESGCRYIYKVTAIDAAGRSSESSNIYASAPGSPPHTASSLYPRLERCQGNLPAWVETGVAEGYAALADDNIERAQDTIVGLLGRIEAHQVAQPATEWREIETLLRMLSRRLALFQAELISLDRLKGRERGADTPFGH